MEVVIFLIKPTANEQIELKSSEQITNTLILSLIKWFVSSIVLFVTKIIFEINSENTGLSEAEKLYSPLTLLLTSSLLFPMIEEISFRLSLKFKAIYLSLSSCVLAYYLVTKLIFHTYNADLGNDFIIRCLSAAIIGVIIYFLTKKYFKTIKTFWENNFRWILYFSILSFAFAHILNYELTLNIILLTPIITLPQLIAGSIYGFIRVKYGFIYNFSAHALNNFIFMSIIFFMN